MNKTPEQIRVWEEERPAIERQVFLGEMISKEADAWAKEKGLPPFASQLDPVLPDPLGKTEWTLAMAAAWMIFRTLDAVREHWDEFRCLPKWRRRKGNLDQEDGAVGWEVRELTPVSLHDVFIKRLKNSSNPLLRYHAEIDRLWGDLGSGNIHAKGIPYVRPRVAGAEPIAIPSTEWAYLSKIDFHGGDKDFIGNFVDAEPLYERVRICSADVIELWPKRSAKIEIGQHLSDLEVENLIRAKESDLGGRPPI